MARDYRPVMRDQQFLLPPDMAEWLAADHLVWFVLDAIAAMDTAAFHVQRQLGGPGRQGFDPDMLLALLVYGYAHGQRSSRQIERLCSVDVAFRVICGQDPPDHSTLARFRQQHETALGELLADVLVLCARAEMGRLGTVAIDGTKIAANASPNANRGEAALRAEAERMLAEAAAADTAEDQLFGAARGDELPTELADPRRRSQRIRRCLAELAAERAERQAAEQAVAEQAHTRYLARVRAGGSTGRPPAGIDPDAVLAARLNREQAKLAAARTAEQRRDARAAAKQARRRHGAAKRAAPAPAAADEPAGDQPAAAAAQPPRGGRASRRTRNVTDPDSRLMPTAGGFVQGYNAQLATSDDHLILAAQLTQQPGDVEQFVPMLAAAAAAARLIEAHRPAGTADPNGIAIVLADAGYLSTTNLTAPGPDRLIATGRRRDQEKAVRPDSAEPPPPASADPIERMRHRLGTSAAMATYRRRGATVEPTIGRVKDVTGLRRFSRRGLPAATSELKFAAAVANLLRLRAVLAQTA